MVDETRSHFLDAWLVGLSVGIALAGFMLAAFPSSAPVEALINRYADAVFWPGATATPAVAAYRSWVFGVTGSVMGGWGLLMAAVAWGPFRRRERWAWLAMSVPVACWYIADTATSVVHGVISNALLNTVLLGLFGVPLLGTARVFLRPRGID